jgi:hypothetical protein
MKRALLLVAIGTVVTPGPLLATAGPSRGPRRGGFRTASSRPGTGPSRSQRFHGVEVSELDNARGLAVNNCPFGCSRASETSWTSKRTSCAAAPMK